MNTVLELAGVALAALLSENLVLVSCMGIGTHEKSFQDPREAIRTGLCLTLVMVLGALGAFPINRGEGDLDAIGKAVGLVQAGHLVGIFPEGTRNRTGGPMRPKSGTAFIARQTGADILPCALVFGERRGFRSRITVKIGPVIPYRELGFEGEERTSLRRASKLIMGRINTLLGWEEAP